MDISTLVVKFGATGAAQAVTIAEQVCAGQPVGFGSATQDRWRANPVTVNGIVFSIFPGLDSTGRADVWIYAAYGEASAQQTWSPINQESATVDLQITLNGAPQSLFGAGTTYSYNHQRSTWLRWQSISLPWDMSSAFINARITDGTFLRHDSRNLFANLDDLTSGMPTSAGYQPFKTFSTFDQAAYIGDGPRASPGGGERTAIGPVHEWVARMICEVGTNNNQSWLTPLRSQIIMDLAETGAQFPHASGFLEPVTNRLLDPSSKPHCSNNNATAWFGATGIPQPYQDGSYDNSHPYNKFSFQAYHLSKDPFHLLLVQGQAICALAYQSLFNNARGVDGKILRLGDDQERGIWWGLQMLVQAWHATPAGTVPKPFRDKAWFATAIDNTLQFIRDKVMSSTTHKEPGVVGEAMRFWRVASSLGANPAGETFGSRFQEDYGNIVLAQVVLLGYTAARDVAEWHAVNIQRRLEAGGSWFLNDQQYWTDTGGFSGYTFGPATGALPYTDVAGWKAWYPRKAMYTDGPTVPADMWYQQYGRDTYLFLGAVNVTKEAARRGLITLGFDIGTAETELRARFTPPYLAPNGNPLNYATYTKQNFSYTGAPAYTGGAPSPQPTDGKPMSFDRVKTTTATTGTGDITVSAAAARYLPLSSIPIGTSVAFVIEDENGTEWEESYCTVLSPNTFSRDTVIKGSNGANKVDFGASLKTVFSTTTADQINAFLTAGSLTGAPAVTAIADPTAVSLLTAIGGAVKRITAADFLTAVGVTAAQLPAVTSANVAGANILEISQPGGDGALSVDALYAYLVNRMTAEGKFAAGATDTTAPAFSSAQVSNATPTVVQITMNEVLNASVVPAASAFAVSGGKTVSSVSISGAVVSLTCNSAYVNGNAITVTYTKPGSGNALQDVAGNATASFGPSTVTNNIAAAGDTVAPTASSAAVANSTPTVVVLTMSEPMDGAYVPAASAFTVGGHTVSSVAVSGNTINLTMSAAFVNGEAARTVAYVQPGANNARDLAGNLLASFSNLAITNNVAASTITVSNPASPQTVGTQYTVSGTWTGTQPTGLDYLLTDNGTAGAWNNVTASLIINTNGTWSFNLTPTTASTSRTITVRNHDVTTVVSAPSSSYVVNAAAAGNVAHTFTRYNGGAPVAASTATVHTPLSRSDVAAVLNDGSGTPYAQFQSTKLLDSEVYWGISPAPVPLVAYMGWGSSPTVAPTQLPDNQIDPYQPYAMLPGGCMILANQEGAFTNGRYFSTKETIVYVPNAAGTYNRYFWIKPADGDAYCLNPTNPVVITLS